MSFPAPDPIRPVPGTKVARAGRPWAREKLDLLRYYIGGSQYKGGGFVTATKRAGGSYYIDLFSGPGQTRVPDLGVIPGSPLIAAAARPAFAKLYWVDADAKNAASLAAHRLDFPGRSIDVWQGDANVAVDVILRDLPRTQPVLAFLDPEGSELHWATIRKLAGHKAAKFPKVELFILFATDTGIVRFFPRDPTKLTHASRLDLMMPSGEGWRELYRHRGTLTPQEFRRGLLEQYTSGLRALGYQYVPAPRMITRPDGRPLYFMVFASDHKAGVRIMQAALERVEDSLVQKTFLPYHERY